MNGFLLVAAGGGIGAMMRHALGLILSKGGGLYAILAANVVGSFLMGLTMAWVMGRGEGDGNTVLLFFCVGVFGGFTTFSSFSLQTVQLIESGQMTKAAIYVLGSVFFAVVMLFVGLEIGRKMFAS